MLALLLCCLVLLSSFFLIVLYLVIAFVLSCSFLFSSCSALCCRCLSCLVVRSGLALRLALAFLIASFFSLQCGWLPSKRRNGCHVQHRAGRHCAEGPTTGLHIFFRLKIATHFSPSCLVFFFPPCLVLSCLSCLVLSCLFLSCIVSYHIARLALPHLVLFLHHYLPPVKRKGKSG